MIAAVALFLVLIVLKQEWKPRVEAGFGRTLLGGLLLGGHWVTYFISLQLSSVAIGMLSLFTYPVITALLEPLFLKAPFQKVTVALGCLAFVGVALLAPELSLDNDYSLGIVVGILSALFYSIRNILLKRQVGSQSGVTIMFHQVALNAIVLSPVCFIYNVNMVEAFELQWQPILILSLFTTATGHTLLVFSFRHFSISTASVISALTPLFGILLGFIFLAEAPTGRTYLGGALVLAAVVYESLRSAKK